MPAATPSDTSGALVDKLKQAFATYDTASKKYLTAVKDLDSAMEQIAIAFRVLSQGELNETTKATCDAFCSAVDNHKCGAESGASKSRRASAEPSARRASAVVDAESYYFANYMSDFACEITAPLEQLRLEVKQLAKTKDKRDEAVKKYEKTRDQVDAMESKLAKKNQSVSDNAEFVKKMAKREQRKALKDSAEAEFSAQYQTLLNKRADVVLKMINAMGNLSALYYEGVSKTLKPRG